ncbi:damage-inducible protein DinI [Pantoea sp. ICBG 1758]|uniref:DinI-like family protein n=1 Tax=Pantoea TaxID=53335 RepID=UPI000CE37EF1|nr:DinI-like family protein [Pantoea sp. ICBG 1758]MDV3143294.1 DinI-like family protein [Sweet potato little leaf phytoplasma]PPC64123.1 damage-inducible protein DinI [Pantoea sp. ICBG 1758]
MIVEVSIGRDKAGKMPEGSMDALREELTRRLSRSYSELRVVVKTASNDGLSVLRARDKDADRERVSEVLQETWESADEWFM